MKTVYCLCLLLLSGTLSFGQYSLPADNASPTRHDTIAPLQLYRPVPAARFQVKNLLIPATMIAYGVTSLRNEELQDANKELQEELWTEHPHRFVHLDNYLQWAPAVAVYGLNAIGVKGAHNFGDRTLIYGLSTLIMASSVYAVKNISGEWRPDNSDRLSFPSGHTATAFAAAEFMRKEYKDVSPWYGVAGYAMAATTGYLRMYNNKHWLSDVVAGAGVGILSTDLAYWLYPSVKRLFHRQQDAHTIAVPFYQQGTVGLTFQHTF